MHHLELYVASLARTKIFYDHLLLEELGFEPYQQWDHGLSYRKGAFYLVFVEVAPEKKAAGYNRTHIGLNHLAFHAKTATQVQRLHDYYQATVPDCLLYDEQFPYAGGPDHFALYLEDPDRFKIEIVAPFEQ